MVNKQCGVCSRYFCGELDGNYTCGDCMRAGAVRRRPLMELGAYTVYGAPAEAEPVRREPNAIHAHGQAA